MIFFVERTEVFDEPLYAHYLSKTDAHRFHPGAEAILEAQENDGELVVKDLLLGESDSPVIFIYPIRLLDFAIFPGTLRFSDSICYFPTTLASCATFRIILT